MNRHLPTVSALLLTALVSSSCQEKKKIAPTASSLGEAKSAPCTEAKHHQCADGVPMPQEEKQGITLALPSAPPAAGVCTSPEQAPPSAPPSAPPEATIFPPICQSKALTSKFLQQYLQLHCPAQAQTLLAVLQHNAHLYEAAHTPAFLPVLCRQWERDNKIVENLSTSSLSRMYGTLMEYTLGELEVNDPVPLCLALGWHSFRSVLKPGSSYASSVIDKILKTKQAVLGGKSFDGIIAEHMSILPKSLFTSAAIKQHLVAGAIAAQLATAGDTRVLLLLKSCPQSNDTARLMAFVAGEVHLRAQDKIESLHTLTEAIQKAVPDATAWGNYLKLICVNEYIHLEQRNPAFPKALLQRCNYHQMIYDLVKDDWDAILSLPPFAHKKYTQALSTLFGSIQHTLANSHFMIFLRERLRSSENYNLKAVQIRTLKALGELIKLMPPHLEEARDALIASVHQGKDNRVCGAATTALVNLLQMVPEQADEVIGKLGDAYAKHSATNARICLLYALGRLAKVTDAASTPKLFDLLKAPLKAADPNVRQNALLALDKLANAHKAHAAAVCRLYQQALADRKDAAAHRAVASILQKWSVPQLMEAYDGHPQLRAALHVPILAAFLGKVKVTVPIPGVTQIQWQLYDHQEVLNKLPTTAAPTPLCSWQMSAEATEELQKWLNEKMKITEMKNKKSQQQKRTSGQPKAKQ